MTVPTTAIKEYLDFMRHGLEELRNMGAGGCCW